MRFTTVVPAFEYNEVLGARECVESVQNAAEFAGHATTRYQAEIILVGRSDGPEGALLDVVADRYDGQSAVTVLRNNNPTHNGVWGAVTAAVEHSDGDFVWPVETRDRLLVTGFASMATMLKSSHAVGLGFGRAELRDVSGPITDPHHEDRIITYDEDPAEFLKHMIVGPGACNRITNSTAVVAESLVRDLVGEDLDAKRAGKPDLNVSAGDWMLYCRALGAGVTHKLLEAPVAVHQVYEKSTAERARLEQRWEQDREQIIAAFRSGRFMNIYDQVAI